jgi:hypothetical protein
LAEDFFRTDFRTGRFSPIGAVAMFSPNDLVQLNEQELKPDDGPNERKPQGQAWPNVLFEVGLAMGRRPSKTVLVRPVGHISRLPPPRRTCCARRCPGLCYGRRTSL